MPTRSQARLKIITQSMAPEEVTALLGLSPDRVRRAGQPRPHTTIIEKTNCWELDSGLSEQCELQEHINALLQKTERCAGQIANLANNENILSGS